MSDAMADTIRDRLEGYDSIDLADPEYRLPLYENLSALYGKRFKNGLSGVVRRLTFVGVWLPDGLIARGEHVPFGLDAAGIFKRMNEVRVQLDGTLDIGAEAFVTRWDLLEDDDG